MTKLTQDQLTKVKEKFCLNIVDNMDLDTLKDIVSDQLIQSYDDWDEVEFKDEVVSYYGEDPIILCAWFGDCPESPKVNTDYGVGK